MKKIAIVNTLPVPSGQASVNRILSYGKGLVECGDSVVILSSGKSIDGQVATAIDGIVINNYGKGKSVFSLFRALLQIVNELRKGKYDLIISASNSLLLIYPLFAMSKLTHAKFVQEKSEFPFVLSRKGLLNKLWACYYVNTTYKLMDAIIVMTHPLLEYFKTKARRKCRFIELPMTVDGSRFNIEGGENELGDYIAYCGDMSGNKDGVANLIEAFSYVESVNKTIKLLLIGGTKSPLAFEKLKQKVADFGLENVIFWGRAERSQIPRLLKNAKILALARPSSLQSTGGFPTKLGEYLSTGNPVVVTSVGDIPRYLNSSNSYLVKPDDNKAFAKAILEILSNYQNASKIGAEGKKVAETVFNYKVQSKRLHDFINDEL